MERIVCESPKQLIATFLDRLDGADSLFFLSGHLSVPLHSLQDSQLALCCLYLMWFPINQVFQFKIKDNLSS